MSQPPTGQDSRIASQNATFFAENEDYAKRVAELTTYKNIRRVIDREVTGVDRLLDIGNGGVFDYDVHLVKQVVGVDLFVDETTVANLPPHVSLRRGDALALPEPATSYDAVLLAFVFHHLTGTTAHDLVGNVERALDEAARVLKVGGLLIVVESCVADWFYPVERVLFKPLLALSHTPLLGDHPPTLQLPVSVLSDLIARRFGTAPHVESIPVGRWILQFGRRLPSRLTPARPWLLTASRNV